MEYLWGYVPLISGIHILYQVALGNHLVAMKSCCCIRTLIARFMGPIWGPPGADRTQVGPMNLAIWEITSIDYAAFCTFDLWFPLWSYDYIPWSAKLKGDIGFNLSVRQFVCPSVCVTYPLCNSCCVWQDCLKFGKHITYCGMVCCVFHFS